MESFQRPQSTKCGAHFCNHCTWGAEVEKELEFQTSQVLGVAVSGRVLTERAQVEFIHRSKRGEKLELLEKESDVGWPEARGRGEI